MGVVWFATLTLPVTSLGFSICLAEPEGHSCSLFSWGSILYPGELHGMSQPCDNTLVCCRLKGLLAGGSLLHNLAAFGEGEAETHPPLGGLPRGGL